MKRCRAMIIIQYNLFCTSALIKLGQHSTIPFSMSLSSQGTTNDCLKHLDYLMQDFIRVSTASIVMLTRTYV
jgi:hypothetical protein